MDKKLLLLRKKLSSKEILGNRKYCVLCDLNRGNTIWVVKTIFH